MNDSDARFWSVVSRKELITYEHFMLWLRIQETTLKEFDENLWRIAVETVTCYPDGRRFFRFVDGEEVAV